MIYVFLNIFADISIQEKTAHESFWKFGHFFQCPILDNMQNNDDNNQEKTDSYEIS